METGRIYSINEPDKLIEFINGELTPKENEKRDNGEVFTPLDLIEEMLDKLNDGYKRNNNGKSIFSEPCKTWFDPAVGIGNFMIIVYLRLMKGLELVPGFLDEETRRKHILENMLYMSELTKNNVLVCNKVFCGDKYALHLYEGDTLKMGIVKEFKITAFDIVVGNPPYNAQGIKHIGDKNIYVYFAKKALSEWTKPGGYMLYIHTPTYRIPNKKIQHTQTDLNEIYTNKNIICIKMFSVQAVLQMMTVMINVDYIIIQNVSNNTKNCTTIIDVNNKEYRQIIYPEDFIPNYGLDIIEKIKNKNKNAGGTIEMELNSDVHAQHAEGNTYKNVHGITKKGIKICMSDKKHKHLSVPKVIINGIGSYNYVFYDKKGEYGVTQSPAYILNPSKNTLQFVQSKLFHYVINATKIIGNNINIKTKMVPIIPEDITINNEQDLYDYFHFTAEEIAEISVTRIPSYINVELLQ